MIEKRIWRQISNPVLHGGTKATNDVLHIASKMGWATLDTQLLGPPPSKIFRTISFILSLFKINKYSTVFMQLPVYGKLNFIVACVIVNRFKSIAIVHDFDKRRLGKIDSTSFLIWRANSVIWTGNLSSLCVGRLNSNGNTDAKIEVWDYLLSDFFQEVDWHPDGAIVFAGNLSPQKVGWLYDREICRPKLQLYGNNFRREFFEPNSGEYWGPFDSDCPQFNGPVGWGLVWDGTKSGEDTIDFDYEKLNQPHKLSLYLACGIPVIVWDQSHAAQLVRKYECGICVPRLDVISGVTSKLSSENIQQMRLNALNLGKKIRSGYFLESALKKSENNML